MLSVGPTLKKLTLLLGIVLLAGVYQQYDVYHQFSKKIVAHDAVNRQQLIKLERMKTQKDEFYAKLKDVRNNYDVMVSQLPDAMRLQDFRKNLDHAFEEEGIKILVQREAHYSRSSYNEVRLTYSLKADMDEVQRIIDALANEERLVTIDNPRDEGNRTVSLGLSIYSRKNAYDIEPHGVRCLTIPGNLLLPFFVSEIEPLYTEYLHTCQALSDNDELNKDIQRYEKMLTAYQELASVRDSIVSAQER